jgi:hypothetical protein
MENKITCPKCWKTIMNDPVIDLAAKGDGPSLGPQFIVCECGERISFWAITSQLRDQNKPVEKFLKWFRGLSKS